MAAIIGDEPGAARFSYKDLFCNPSMAFLLFARILDPIATTSIYSYMFAQLKWLSPEASDVQIAFQAGMLVASKTAAKCITGLPLGRLSDKSYGGRKLVLLLSLFSSCIATLGFGLSRSFGLAIFFQIISGLFNQSTGVIRCMVAELETRPTHSSRALLLLPLCGSIGQLCGPLLGGFLTSLSGSEFLARYPFFAPNAAVATMYGLGFIGCYFFVEETLETFDRRQGSALRQCFSRLFAFVRGKKYEPYAYTRLSEGDVVLPNSPQSPDPEDVGPTVDGIPTTEEKPVLSFWQIWTPQVVCTLTAHFIIAGHVSTFATTSAVFFASPVAQYPPVEDGSMLSFFRFTGGAGLTPPQLGILNSTVSFVGVLLQTLLPRLNDIFGMVTVWRSALCLFPFAYFIAPYTAWLAAESGRAAAWTMLSVTMLLYVVGRTGAQPAMTLLINACTPSPDARGTINVAGTVVGNLARSVVPVTVMSVYGWGFENRLVTIGFWIMCVLAVIGIIASRWVKEKKPVQPNPPLQAPIDLETGR